MNIATASPISTRAIMASTRATLDRPVPRGADASSSSRAATQAVEDARRAVDDVIGYFSSIGVSAREGAEKIKVSFDPTYPNAHYDLQRDEMVIGVNPETGRSFADSPDVIAHELGHRIAYRMGTISMRARDYFGENAAVQEHVADVLAASYDQKDWTLGEGSGSVIRDMAAPERLGHPASMSDVKRGIEDGSLLVSTQLPTGAVVKLPNWHDVAEVPNRAASMIGDAIGRDELGKLYLDALRSTVTPGMSLSQFADAITAAAATRYGAASPESAAVTDAYDAVGLLRGTTPR